MKKTIAFLLALCLLLSGIGAQAAYKPVEMTLDGNAFSLAFESAEIVGGALVVRVSGFGDTPYKRDGKTIVPFWASAVIGGKTVRAAKSAREDGGVIAFKFDSNKLPEAVMMSPFGRDGERVTIWDGTWAADASDVCGKWRLDTVWFFTPEANDAYAIDRGILVESDGGDLLRLFEDGTVDSDAGASDLIEYDFDLPFYVEGLNFFNYETWACEDEKLVFGPDAPELAWEIDGDTGDLRVKWAGEVFVEDEDAEGAYLPMEITLVFAREEWTLSELGIEDEIAQAVLEALNEPLYTDTYVYLIKGNTVGRGSNSAYGKALQTLLAALGQSVTVDGRPGDKTVVALNKVQSALGLDVGASVGAPCFLRMLKCLLCILDDDTAYDVLSSYDEYAYLRGCAFALKGEYYKAYREFYDSSWEDAEARAEGCVLSWPKNGEVYRNSAYRGQKTRLNIKIDSQSEGYAALLKIYAANGDLVSGMFIAGAGKVTAKLPGGTYTIKMGTGEMWFGPNDAFGNMGEYETMLFDNGASTVTLKSGYEYTLTIHTSVSDPTAGGVGSEYEDF